MKANVALVCGQSRYANVAGALERIASQVDLQNCRLVLVKPNFVSTSRQLAATHVDAVRAILDFVRARHAGRLVIAEGAALSNTREAFERFGYLDLVSRYDLSLVDLNADSVVPLQIYDRRMKPKTVGVARTVVESDFRISVGPPKTHDTVVVTLSLKNIIMGSLVNPTVADPSSPRRLTAGAGRTGPVPGFVLESPVARRVRAYLSSVPANSKTAMHQGYPVMNLNLALLAPHVWPHLAVVDGLEGMEGAGPVGGDRVEWGIALAGTDALAVDTLAAHLMGFDPAGIGYLSYCRRLALGTGELDDMIILGNASPDLVRRRFKPHPEFRRQGDWHLADADRYLHGPAGDCQSPPAEEEAH